MLTVADITQLARYTAMHFNNLRLPLSSEVGWLKVHEFVTSEYNCAISTYIKKSKFDGRYKIVLRKWTHKW